jgi:hypothetical protein
MGLCRDKTILTMNILLPNISWNNLENYMAS